MTTRQVAGWFKTVPGIVVVVLTALALVAGLGGSVVDVFRTPARVHAVEVEVRGHHDTLQVVFRRSANIDSVHAESHAIQQQLRDIGFMICDMSDISALECQKKLGAER